MFKKAFDWLRRQAKFRTNALKGGPVSSDEANLLEAVAIDAAEAKVEGEAAKVVAKAAGK